ncbi:hypothetical protein M8818_002622 [Zalaria obscura]|uniref:Uncharacterized protein n=1 Tax=Zalaria obscura TaxID=2024903 RepID=A0ACC3SGF7_9PEZI
MSAAQHLHTSLLRAPVLHILRAAGFHSTRPSVLDTLVNITERYLLLLATTTAQHALLNHNDLSPTLTDVRMALTDCGILVPVHGGAEEEWTERLRRPLDDYDDLPHGAIRRDREIRRREEEDTRDVRDFIRWIVGEQNREIRRIAGLVPEAGTAGTAAAPGATAEGEGLEDYLALLKKKHSKTGEESRYQGTVLGKQAEDRVVKIEGGPVETLREWEERVRTMVLKAQPVVESVESVEREDGRMEDEIVKEEQEQEQDVQMEGS